MSMPALACFAKLRADRRNSTRRSLTAAQKTCVISLSLFLFGTDLRLFSYLSFLDPHFFQHMPRSYRRFLWFIATLGLSLLALIIGQGFATVYLSTLPHSNVEGIVYVWTLIITINVHSLFLVVAPECGC
jgi:hypothetical protein